MNKLTKQIILSCLLISTAALAQAGSPLFTLTPLTATTVSVPSNSTAQVQYTVTNNTRVTRALTIQPITAVTQVTTGVGVCTSPFTLTYNQSCTLTLNIDGATLAAAPSSTITSGPIVCKTKGNGDNNADPFLCSQPSAANSLNVTAGNPLTSAAITVTGSPLTLTASSGTTGNLTITNTSSDVTATNITSDLTGALATAGVTQSATTCISVAPLSSCTLTFLPGSSAVAQTSFPIAGDNTNTITAAITVSAALPTLTSVSPVSGAAAGGTGVTLTGTNLTGTTGVTFGGTAATSVNVVSATSVTAVTPAHAIGAVDVIITTAAGSATLPSGYTYLTTAVGQPAYGGTIACLNGGLNNLIAATVDNSVGIAWDTTSTNVPTATSTTNGDSNTTAIVATLGAGSNFAAGLCSNYVVDSLGNTPCQSGNTCYTDWFLPAGNDNSSAGQLNCLYTNQGTIGGFAANGVYWSSTQVDTSVAWDQDFANGTQVNGSKINTYRVRCVRAFTP
jgi:hypothetical protein